MMEASYKIMQFFYEDEPGEAFKVLQQLEKAKKEGTLIDPDC
jgi:START domain